MKFKYLTAIFAKFSTLSNRVTLVLAAAVYLLMPSAAFSQGAGFLIDLARRQGGTLTESRTFSVADLNDEARNRILAANRQKDFQAVAAQNDLIVSAAGRGNPFINFEDGKTLASVGGNLTNANPVALAAADFDADGTEDLAVVYATENGAIVSVRRGNVESIFPPNADAKPAPFFSEMHEFELLLVPDFLVAGDFTGDGRADLLVAKRGFDSLVLLGGNGDGSFAAPKIVKLKGEVTALATGEINNFDNLPDVAVGIVEKGKAQVLIFQSRGGAFGAEAEVLKISKAANALGIGNLDGDSFGDLIAATDSELIFSAGANLQINAKRGEIKAERILRQKVNFSVKDIAISDFVGDANTDFAMLSKNGEIFIGNFKGEGAKKNLRISPSSLAVSNASSNAKLITAKVSTRQKTELIVAGNQNLQIISSDGENLSNAAAFDANSETIAVLPMRLNKDALNDLVVLSKNNLEPSVLMTAPMSVITVNSSNGSGGTENGTTLLTAINSANNSPGLDEIQFNLPAGSPPISMNVALPPITDAITINGLSQTNENGEPLVSITINAATPTDGPTLEITAGNSVVRGLIVNSTSTGIPIVLGNGGNNFIESNYIGTNNAGTASSFLTTATGIFIGNSSGNQIGGAMVQARNIISGLQDSLVPGLLPFDGVFSKPSGVRIHGGGSTNNFIQGNYIGLDKNGSQIVSNAGCGVLLSTAASGNIIGGATGGERNIISGNGCGVGIVLPENSTSSVVIENNFIGTDKDGTTARGNLHDGIAFQYFGTMPAQTSTASVYGNVVSGNAENAIAGIVIGATILSANRTNAPEGGADFLIDLARRRTGNLNGATIPAGNRIGTNAAGTAAIPNGGNGVALENFSALVEGNLISGNGANGIFAKPPIASSLPFEIAGNYIGTDVSGNLDLGNAGEGISLEYSGAVHVDAQSTEIISNVISGNGGDGVKSVGNNLTFPNLAANKLRSDNNVMPRASLFMPSIAYTTSSGWQSATGNIPTGNFIGTNAAGTAALPNGGNGVSLQNVPALVEGNLISANGQSGIFITGETPFGNFIADNFIGTNIGGDTALGNAGNGFRIETQSEATSDTQTTQIYDNLISGNTGDGVFASVTNSPENNVAPEGGASFLIDLARRPGNLNVGNNPLFQGNRIGTNAGGTSAIPNSGNGVNLLNASAKIESNLISGNGINGVEISQLSYQLGQLNANLIGTNADGTAAIANGGNGVNLEITLAPTINVYQMTDNLISGNANDGFRCIQTNPGSGDQLAGTGITVDISGSRSGNVASFGATSDGNYIGVNASGTAAIPNGGNGINLMETEAIIEGNLISGNAAKGVTVQNSLLGQLNANRIGTNAAGNAAIPNGTGGVALEMQISQTDDAYEITDNLISGNTGDGIRIFPSSSGASQIVGGVITVDISGSRTGNLTPTSGGNFIGTKTDGVSALPNTGNGIAVINVPTKIGGNSIDDGNIIAFNGANGIVIFGGTGNRIMNNPIFANAVLPIDLGGDGVTPNDLLDADTGANNLQNYPVITTATIGSTRVIGTFNSTPNSVFRLEFFNSPTALDGGKTFIGAIDNATTDALGNFVFDTTFAFDSPAGSFITATATDASGNTSEFSAAKQVFAPTAASVSVGGKIFSPQGTGVEKAVVTITAPNGETRSTLTNSFGYYRFTEVQVGGNYVISVRSKLYNFSSRVVTVNEAMTVNFTAE